METKLLGPTFADDLRLAGLAGLAISWSPDGTINHRDGLTAQQNTALDAVIAAHDPNKQPPATFRGGDLIDLLTPDDLVAIEGAVEGSAPDKVALRLLWIRLRSRGEKPIDTSSEAFEQGWTALAASLAPGRAAALAAAIGIPA